MSVFTFDEALHEYRVDGVRLPSVTQLLEPIKPDFYRVATDVLEAKRAFGVAVHTACELDDLGELDDDGTDARVMQCVAAWRKFKLDTAAVVLMTEQKLYHPGLRFAGTLDGVLDLTFGPKLERGIWLVDRKTGVHPHPSFGVQTAAYHVLLRANGPTFPNGYPMKRGTVHLFDDGTYRLHQFNDHADEATFMACLAIHAHKEKTL